jgi:putative peptidoglycan lipid II flippase
VAVARVAMALTAINFLALLVRFLATSAFAFRHGTSPLLDSYFAGASIPLSISAILTSAYAMTAIPVFSRWRRAGTEKFQKRVSKMMHASFWTCAAISLLISFFSHKIVDVLVPGLSETNKDFAALTLAIQIWSLPALILSELLTSVLFVRGHYLWPSIVKLTASLCTTIAVGLLVGKDGLIAASALTVLFAGLNFLVIFPSSRKHTLESVPVNSTEALTSLRAFVSSYLILVAGMLTYRALPIFDRWLASDLPSGAISTMTYALRIIDLPQSLILSGLVTSTFPFLSNLKANGESARVSQLLEKLLLGTVMIFGLVASLGYFFGEPIIRIVLGHGAMSAKSVESIFELFRTYCFALPAMAACGVMGQAYYINQANRTVAVFGAVETAVYIGSCTLLVKTFGLLGFAYNYTFFYFRFFCVNALYLQYRFGYRLFSRGVGGMALHVFTGAISCLPALIIQKVTGLNGLTGMFLYSGLSALIFLGLQKLYGRDEFHWIRNHFSLHVSEKLRPLVFWR